MNVNDKEIKDIINFHCPRFSELPQVPLYKDQVIYYIEQELGPININKTEKLLTPTMLNNYVKQKVIYPPKNKKYDQYHLAYLIVVCIFKQIFSLSEVCELIQYQISICSTEHAYDTFCGEIEMALKSVFKTRDFTEANSKNNESIGNEILRSAVMCFANKVYIQKFLKDRTNKEM
ncbi:MAG: DUF1836 domain-containing protein [Clostridiaceae bacterium]|nr:DUF1836 domain-containing protein [Clostridiaceae bacterium]